MYPTWPSSNAVDGDIGQYVGDGATCVATKTELNPYIIIDLGAEYILTSVKIYKQVDDGIELNIQLLLMEKTWTSYGIFEETKKLLKPYVATRLVRLQVSEEVPVVLRICEMKVFALCQEGTQLRDSEKVIHDQSKPYMQMRFSLSNKYNDVVKEEAAFVYSVKQELAILTNFSEASFQNMKVQKDPLQVELELHSTDGDLKKLSKMLETIDMLCEHGLEMTTEDGSELTIIAGSLQYHVMYTGHAGALLYSPMLVAVSLLAIAMSNLY
ncbi:uncharacterized protein LOC132720875 [Ruditapes philippinarum]|uniref:uncharacterized protein LOC132720875 n=1 Tax=Ruditapes philippinarum TaxID=129788 RepID=UPI00295C31BC|nr:uncharacterized protein LOC132720875 [Ruditapes philippinarum]